MTRSILNALGMPATKYGHWYLDYAVEITRGDRTLLLSVTKRLYPQIAEHFHTSPQSVEHGIRYCIKQCWDTGNRPLFYEIAEHQLDSCPYAGEFIAMLTDYVS